MIPQEEITPKTHTMTRWLDVDAPVDLEGCIHRSRYSKEGAEYAILELTGDEQWIILKVYTTYEQQEEMHYDGIVTCQRPHALHAGACNEASLPLSSSGF